MSSFTLYSIMKQRLDPFRCSKKIMLTICNLNVNVRFHFKGDIMKLKLNKKKLKNLSKDHQSLPADITPQIGGGLDKERKPPFHSIWGGCDPWTANC